MKRFAMIPGAVALGVCAMIVGSIAQAEKDDLPKEDKDRTQQRTTIEARKPSGIQSAGRLDDKLSGANIRASEFIGMNIQNAQGEGLGEVNDIVIDASNGKVRYAAVTYGGFLGLGNKMFAVPFGAFEVRTEEGDSDDYILVLNVTQSQLEGAQGFNEDNWPDFGDRTFTDEVDRRYGVERQRRDRRQGVDVEVDREGVDVDVDDER
ncbi:PRC-barrel domain protein [Maioricimonas rarisocia]|uniref:PRC-barrel domain protein n=1 Tax=Maioricimonas rarisocia TaxID=2528026 RepID=A0A517ZEP7_9PLAN|nr:PRC-barrel domain-containing protein [Maioricimonas rarisocia]QDU40934.1 PRC-barrel domain protein [Maioricimonas rarisocia]